jgi:hypothetical protein
MERCDFGHGLGANFCINYEPSFFSTPFHGLELKHEARLILHFFLNIVLAV